MTLGGKPWGKPLIMICTGFWFRSPCCGLVAWLYTNTECSNSCAEKAKPAAKPKLNKTKTMAATQKEAKEILGDEELAHTRSGKKEEHAAAEDKTDDEAEEQPAKKPRITKTKTMAATAAESKEVTGNKKRGKTRAATDATPKLKKTTTMAATAKVRQCVCVCVCVSVCSLSPSLALERRLLTGPGG
jgi:hypothetical protein